MKITILSTSVRTSRNSHRVALFFKNYIEANRLASVQIADLQAYQFPIFEERLKFQKNPIPQALEFARLIAESDGIIVVAPEYNGGYPASLKNAMDLLNEEWKRKPVAFATVSTGAFGGMNLITALQFSFWKLQAWTVPALFPVPKVTDSFDENGTPSDTLGTEKRAKIFTNELLWCMEAKMKMEE